MAITPKNTRTAMHVGSFALLLRGAAALATPPAQDFDVIVYDATSGGVMAAVAAARHGAKTALLCASWPACFPEGGQRVGGMSSGGLGQTDVGSCPDKIGGFAREFYRRNRARYAAPGWAPVVPNTTCRVPTASAGCDVAVNLEPHVALSNFEAMLAEANVSVFYSAQVDSVKLAAGTAASSAGKAIESIALVDGRRFSARVWLDAGYEGDLLARAGASFVTGREAGATYNESLAGRRPGTASNEMDLPINPYVSGTRCAQGPWAGHPRWGTGRSSAVPCRAAATADGRHHSAVTATAQ